MAATVRDSVAGLRSLLVDIYPPSLRDAGLTSALHDLVRGASGHDAAVVAETDAEAADAVPEPQQEIMFRIAQEALRNAVRHAGAGHIMLRLTPTDQGEHCWKSRTTAADSTARSQRPRAISACG